MVQVALPKRSINKFEPVQQNRQQAKRAYCPDILYTIWYMIDKYCGHLTENMQ